MPANFDDPIRDSVADPLCRFIRGWLWLDTLQRDNVAIAASLPQPTRKEPAAGSIAEP